MRSSQRLREAIHATVKQTDNDLEAQRQATEFALRKRIHEMKRAKDEDEWPEEECKYILILGVKFCFISLDSFVIVAALLIFGVKLGSSSFMMFVRETNDISENTHDTTSFTFSPFQSHNYSIGGFEWISINLSKSAVFSLQTSENNLKPP